MRQNLLLTIASLLSILFTTLHLAGDIVYGYEPGTVGNLIAVPIVHMQGKGVGVASRMVNTSGHFFFVWTLLALGVTGLFGVILSVRGLWSLRRGQSR